MSLAKPNTSKLLVAELPCLEGQLEDGSFFNGESFSLVDAAYSPAN
jgi:glutathione S-transferase